VDPERWQRIELPCQAVLDCNPSERDVYLRGASGGEADLCREVEDLIAYQAVSSADGQPVRVTTGSSAMDAQGRLLVTFVPQDSGINRLAIVDTATGRMTRVPGEQDYHTAGWTRDRHIIAIRRAFCASLLKFTPQAK
jgi:hypothetical protein